METEEPPSSEEPPGWHDWKWQFKNRIKSVEKITKLIGRNVSSIAANKFPMAITPYYFSLIKTFNETDPIFKMCVPQNKELIEIMCEDPLCEELTTPTKCLVHRYDDRALLISTTTCATNCRYCTRKRTVGIKKHVLTAKELKDVVAYLTSHPEVSDVIISGGDPFTLETRRLEKIIQAIRNIETVDIIRIGTKVPVVMPQRITDELVAMLKRYHPIFVNTHFNHPNEITKESSEACQKLVDNGIPVNNQSVLLKGVNDNKYVQEDLCRKLLKMRVRSYYLFQCDLVNGVEHFRTKISRGIEIMDYLRGRLSGLAIPQYVVDSPGGKGKIPILPNYMLSQSPEKVILRNYKGEIVEYPEID
jgi:lysine 2,3-aminomutase